MRAIRCDTGQGGRIDVLRQGSDQWSRLHQGVFVSLSGRERWLDGTPAAFGRGRRLTRSDSRIFTALHGQRETFLIQKAIGQSSASCSSARDSPPPGGYLRYLAYVPPLAATVGPPLIHQRSHSALTEHDQTDSQPVLDWEGNGAQLGSLSVVRVAPVGCRPKPPDANHCTQAPGWSAPARTGQNRSELHMISHSEQKKRQNLPSSST
ncbi:unnamed protein product [Lota lota]